MTRIALSLALVLATGCSGESEVDRVTDAVRYGMRDPDAAQFRQVEQCTADASVWQGEVNGKNAYGAYTGYEFFYYLNGEVIRADDSVRFGEMLTRCFGPDAAM